ncbi:MAG: OFA family MFS transporter [Promethearchaeota archaeon]
MSAENQAKVMNRWIVVIGAVLIQLALGTIYCWGNLTTYLTSYIRITEPNVLYGDTIYIFAVGLMAFAITMIFSGQLQQKIGPMKVGMIGGVLVSLGVILSSFMTNLTGFLITYGVLFGVGIGFAYVCPIACAAKWFPDKKGMINGIAVAGFGAGAFIFNKITTYIVNPTNIKATIVGTDGKLYFDPASPVVAKVPSLLILLGVIYAIMIIGGSFTLKNPPEGWLPKGWTPPSITKDEEGKQLKIDYNRSEAIKMPQFWMLWLMFILTAAAGLFTIGNYKTFGKAENTLITDKFLSDVGAWAALFNGLGRIVWGTLSDKIGYKKAMSIMFGVQAVFMFTLPLTPFNQYLFMLWVCLIYFCFGGNFSLYPTATADTFGAKYLGPNYGIVFTAYGIAGVAGALLASTIGGLIGFQGLFITMGILSIVAIIIAFLLKPPKAVAKKTD